MPTIMTGLASTAAVLALLTCGEAWPAGSVPAASGQKTVGELRTLLAAGGKQELAATLLLDKEILLFPTEGTPRVWQGGSESSLDAERWARFGGSLDKTAAWRIVSPDRRRLGVVSPRKSGGIAFEAAPIKEDSKALVLPIDGALRFSEFRRAGSPAGLRIVGVRHSPAGDELLFYDGEGERLGGTFTTGPISSLTLAADGTSAAALTAKHTYVFDDQGNLKYKLPPASDLRSSEDGRRHVLFLEGSVKIFDEASPGFARTGDVVTGGLDIPLAGTPRDASFASEAPVLGIIDETRAYRVDLDTKTLTWKRELTSTESPGGEPRSVAVAPDGSRVAVGRVEVLARRRRDAQGAAEPGNAEAYITVIGEDQERFDSERFETHSWNRHSPLVSFHGGPQEIYAESLDQAAQWSLP